MDHLPMSKFGPLARLCTVFSGTEIAGPFARQMFAEWGTEAIWIENVAQADTIRVQPNYPQPFHRNLYALSLNIFKDESREALLKLTRTADISAKASKGPAFTRRSTTDKVLWQYNPKLVIAHLPGSGQCDTEECTNLPAYNTITQVFNGYLIQNGDVDQPMPVLPYTVDYSFGPTVTTAMLVTLHKVYEVDRGEGINIAMYEMTLRMGQYFMMDYSNGGGMYPCMSEGKDPYYAGYSLYKCADGYVVMGLVGITQIEECFKDIGLAYLLDIPEIPEDTQLIHHIECLYGPLVEERLDTWLTTHTIVEIKEHFAELNIARAEVLTVPKLESNPQYVARKPITQWQTMDGRTCKGPNIVPEFKNNPGQIWRGMPSHGTDMAAILKNIGYNENDIQELVSKGLAKVEDQTHGVSWLA